MKNIQNLICYKKGYINFCCRTPPSCNSYIRNCKASYTRLARSPQNVFATQKHARNETCVDMYSRCCGHFTNQIFCFSHFELFHAGSGKITKSKDFYPKNI